MWAVLIDLFKRLLYLTAFAGFSFGWIGFLINSYEDYQDLPKRYIVIISVIMLTISIFLFVKGIS